MSKYSDTVKNKLTSMISSMASNLTSFVKNPGVDFTRDRKLPFETMIKLLISMGGNTIYKELLEAHNFDANTATASAFVQQRDKILPCTFEHLLNRFTYSHTDIKTYRGYRLLAADGSELHFATNPDDSETYYQTSENAKGYNLLHINVLYDLCNRLYVDTLIQPSRLENEKRALCDMVDRSAINGKTIVIGDRGYENYNAFEHIKQKGWNYLIRVKDIDSTGILSGLDLPNEEEFDINVYRVLTRRQTNHIKANPHIYRFIPNNVNFDFLPLKSKEEYPISFRIVRIRIETDYYQTIVTNLDKDEFPPEAIKRLYKMRWGIETSFRELKYAVGLINLHSKKREYVIQEVFARIIMHNFSEMITSHVVIAAAITKHAYQVNFTIAIHVCKRFLNLPDNIPPPDVEAIIRKNTLPVRADRTAKMVLRSKSSVSFVYRRA